MPPTQSQFDAVELKSCAPFVSSPFRSVTFVGQASLESEHLCGASTFVGRRECPLFVDPFHQDWREFEELERSKGLSMLTHPQAMLAACPVRQDSYQESLMLSTQRIFQVDAKAPSARPEPANAEAELHKAVLGSGSERIRLTPALAVHIFNHGKTHLPAILVLAQSEQFLASKSVGCN